jgi:hypothetical protein
LDEVHGQLVAALTVRPAGRQEKLVHVKWKSVTAVGTVHDKANPDGGVVQQYITRLLQEQD